MPTPKPAFGKILLSASLTFLIATLLIISCRKVEQTIAEEPSIAKQESKFFTNHPATDSLVQDILGFVKRENDKYHFVDNLIKKIGYPYWDKSLTIRKGAGANTRTTTDSANTTYIPFVLDSQNNVNSTLVINTSPSDTNFYFIADWQYRQRTYSPTVADSSAESFALFFMMMDRRVFEHTEFQITDTLLFAAHPRETSNSLRKVYLLNTSSPTGKMSLEDYEECLVFAVCETPGYCSNHGGCDYQNCVSDPDVCYIFEMCWEYDFGGGGSGSGGSEGPPGGPPSGGGGSGGGGWEPPICPETPEGGKLTIIEECDPGWEPPVPIANQSIIDSLQGYPCAQNILAMLPNLNNTTQNILQNTFGVSENFNIIFRADTTMPAYENGATSRVVKNVTTNTYDIKIRLNSNMLKNSSKEFILNVMFHESIHAYMNYQWFLYNTNQIDSTTFKTQFPIIWNYKNGSNSQHVEISNTYVSKLKQTVLDFNNTADSSMVRALSWVGLQATPAWLNLANDTIDIRQKASIAKYGTLSQMTAYNLQKCN